MAATFTDSYPVRIGTQSTELPIVPLHEGAAIALLMTIDRGVGFMAAAGLDLADQLRSLTPDIVVTNATLGIPVAIEVSRSLGLDDYLVLQKTPKIHLGDASVEPLTSITTDATQVLRLDRARTGAVAGRRVVVVDDVIATGGSIAAACRLLRNAGAEIVGIGALLVEGSGWRHTLGDDAELVTSLGAIPEFVPSGDGGWVEAWS